MKPILYELIDDSGKSHFQCVPVSVATEFELSLKCDYVVWTDERISHWMAVMKAIDDSPASAETQSGDDGGAGAE